jgi:hypothetical protein
MVQLVSSAARLSLAVAVLFGWSGADSRGQIPPAELRPAEDETLAGTGHHLGRVELSSKLIVGALGRSIEKTSTIERFVLGTRVRGSALTQGTLTLRLREESGAAAGRLSFAGHTTSRTVGRNGPAIICSEGMTRFRTTKRISFDTNHGFRQDRARISATTNLKTTGVCATMGGLAGRLVRGVARAAGEQRLPRRGDPRQEDATRGRIAGDGSDQAGRRQQRRALPGQGTGTSRDNDTVLRDVLPVLRENLPLILDTLGETIEGTSAEVTGLAFIALKRQLGDKYTQSMVDELGRSRGGDVGQAYLGFVIAEHLRLIDTLEVAQQHASPELRQVFQRQAERAQARLQQARQLMSDG